MSGRRVVGSIVSILQTGLSVEKVWGFACGEDCRDAFYFSVDFFFEGFGCHEGIAGAGGEYSFWWTRRRATRSKNCLEFISVVAFKVVKAFGASPVAGLYFSPSAVDGDVGSFLGGFEDERKLVFVFQIGGTEVA